MRAMDWRWLRRDVATQTAGGVGNWSVYYSVWFPLPHVTKFFINILKHHFIKSQTTYPNNFYVNICV